MIMSCDNGDLELSDMADESDSVLMKEFSFRDHDIFVKNEECFEITSMARLKSGNYLVICDHGNKCIKLLDESFNITSRLSTAFHPWGIAAVTPSFLVVSFPLVMLLQYIKVKDESKLAYWYPVKSGNEYYGLACDSGCIAAICKDDNTDRSPSVHILDQAGNIEHVIYKTSDRGRLFKNPDFLTVSDTTHVFYVADTGLRTVFSFKKDGRVLQTFSHSDCDPAGLCVDNLNNTVYVCDKQGDCIYHLRPDLHPLQCLTSKHDKTIKPLSVIVINGSQEDHLVIAMENVHFLRVFQL